MIIKNVIVYCNKKMEGQTQKGNKYVLFSIWKGTYWNCITFNPDIMNSLENKARYNIYDLDLTSFKKQNGEDGPRLVIKSMELVETPSTPNNIINDFDIDAFIENENKEEEKEESWELD